jgi:hypothetical protein
VQALTQPRSERNEQQPSDGQIKQRAQQARKRQQHARKIDFGDHMPVVDKRTCGVSERIVDQLPKQHAQEDDRSVLPKAIRRAACGPLGAHEVEKQQENQGAQQWLDQYPENSDKDLSITDEQVALKKTQQ